jgi:hypothetical protein
MTTNQPVELGKASEQTKQIGLDVPDNFTSPTGDRMG